jgi:hypothetical protein
MDFVDDRQEHDNGDEKVTQAADSATAYLISRAAELMAQKLSEAISPMFHMINRRLERVEARINISNDAAQYSVDGQSSVVLCAAPGCERPARARGLCSAHYQRVRYQEKKLNMVSSGAMSVQDARLRNPPRTCSIDGCDRPVKARGLCSAHYQRKLYRERKNATIQFQDGTISKVVEPVEVIDTAQSTQLN